MKQLVVHTPEAPLSDELLGLLLDEAERALLAVDARADDTGQRVLHGNVPDPDRECAPGVNELRLAIAELADAFPTIHADLETIGERMRNLGAKAGTSELESYPHVLDLVRMSLEVLFRNHPSADS